MFMISEMQGRIKTSLVTKDVIVNLSPMFKRLESDVYLCTGLLKNNILKCFRWPVLYGMIHLVRTQNFSKNYYFLPPDTYTYQLINELSHIETNSSSCIYLIFTNQSNLSVNSGSIHLYSQIVITKLFTLVLTWIFTTPTIPTINMGL